MPGAMFVQPVAVHSTIPDYLIVRNSDRQWFLWLGDDDRGLVEIPASTATWMRMRPEIEPLPTPHLWFEAASLPLASCQDSSIPT